MSAQLSSDDGVVELALKQADAETPQRSRDGSSQEFTLGIFYSPGLGVASGLVVSRLESA
jgi:hypothetical protein